MTKQTIARSVAVLVGFAMVSGFAGSAGAVTIAELQAQINALMAQLSALQGGTTVSTGVVFTQNLTVGSTGSEVVALQQQLVAQGHLTMPAGVAYGYFGPLTRAAVAQWQAANGVAPAVGYWGPISRAAFAASAGTTGGTTTGGTTTGGTTTTGTITTPGVEGTITASKNPTPASGVKIYEAGSKVGVLGLKLEAKLSDIKVERVKIQLSAGTSGNSDQQFYTKIADRMYVMDGSTVLASVDLNSDTVVKESSSYYITITGFNFIVPKDSIKVLTIAVDPKTSWDTAYDNDSWTLTVPADGIRGIDGAGINQYSPTATFNNSFTSAADVVDSAALSVSLATDSPVAAQVIADQGSSDNEYDDLTLAKVNFKSEKDQVKVTDLIVDIVRGGTTSTATATTAYIYDGSTLVGSATVVGSSLTAMTATFSDIDWIIPADTTKVLTVKVDIDSAGGASTTFVAGVGNVTAVATAITSENSVGTSITETGSATGNTITVRNVGLEIALVSKSIVKGSTPISSNTSTSTAEATFTLRLTAVGGAIRLGTNASTTGAFVDNDGNGASATAPSFLIFRGGTDVTASLTPNASTTGFTIPTTGTTAEGTNSRILPQGGSIEFPVSFLFEGKTAAGALVTAGSYSVQLANVNWVSASGLQASDFMSSDLDWRTSSVSMP